MICFSCIRRRRGEREVHTAAPGDSASIRWLSGKGPSGRFNLFFAGLWLLFQAGGCAVQSATWLTVLEPVPERQTFSIWQGYTLVDSLQPVLAWEPFVLDRQNTIASGHATESARSVRYELRIWETRGGYEGKLVYVREDLTATRHRVEHPLAPGSRFLWSVRATFERDRAVHVTPWGTSSRLLDAATVPNPACYRFATPAVDAVSTDLGFNGH